MRINRKKIDVVLSKNGMTIKEVAAAYGCSPNRIHAILNSLNVKPQSAGKLASALKCDVTDLKCDVTDIID